MFKHEVCDTVPGQECKVSHTVSKPDGEKSCHLSSLVKNLVEMHPLLLLITLHHVIFLDVHKFVQ